jgi:ubiquinone biosynthesis protein UbiJ
MQPTVVALAALEAAINAYLRLDPATVRRLAQLSGKVIAVELRGIGFTLFVLPGPERVQVLGRYEGEPDACLRGTPLALARMGLAADASAPLFAGEVTISGDVELGQAFKAALDAMEVDWEEHLSRIVGDVLAHQLGNLARGFAAWVGRSGELLGSNLGEYLQEERRALPHPLELEGFLAEVDELRNDVERLEARVQRLLATPAAPAPAPKRRGRPRPRRA